MLLYPNAKINLGLHVGPKREDGYHELQTIYYPVYQLHDELEVHRVSRGTISLHEEGILADCAKEKNLVVRAYHLMKEQFSDKVKAVSVRLKKNIPFGAGLGGGSADGAFMAMALNQLFELGLGQEALADIVKSLGADCPFFIYNSPSFGKGIGTELRPVQMNLSGMYLLMIKPEVSISTKEAYEVLDSAGRGFGTIARIAGMWLSGMSKMARLQGFSSLSNDFEGPIFKQHPILGEIKKKLLDAGALYASMSGSGSTIYGLFETNDKGRPFAELGTLEEEFAPMIIFNDTLRQTKS